jgi:hypothetical protein
MAVAVTVVVIVAGRVESFSARSKKMTDFVSTDKDFE